MKNLIVALLFLMGSQAQAALTEKEILNSPSYANIKADMEILSQTELELDQIIITEGKMLDIDKQPTDTSVGGMHSGVGFIYFKNADGTRCMKWVAGYARGPGFSSDSSIALCKFPSGAVITQ